ncbi:hypothetical protein AgCh_029622 [Apium graveolens]
MNIDHEDVFDQYEMLRDAFGEQDYTNPEDFGDQDHTHKEPNFEASRFYTNMHNLDAPIYPGNTKFTKLMFVMRSVHFKSQNNCSDTGFDELLSLIADVLPEEHTLPSKYQDIKKMVKKINLGYEKIYACENDWAMKAMDMMKIVIKIRWMRIMTKLKIKRYYAFNPDYATQENARDSIMHHMRNNVHKIINCEKTRADKKIREHAGTYENYRPAYLREDYVVKNKKEPSVLEHFKELHSLRENGALTSPEAKNIMDCYEKIYVDKNIDPTTTSLELWVKAVGGVRKNKILGKQSFQNY